MRRREVITVLTGAAAWPLAARGQSLRTDPARIGVLQWGRESAASLQRIEVFRHELRHLGYVEGRNIELEVRFAQESGERAAAIAEEFARLNLDVIVAAATPGVHAAKAATQQIPIVMSNVADPLATGLVKSLSRPGGNITGRDLSWSRRRAQAHRAVERDRAGLEAHRISRSSWRSQHGDVPAGDPLRCRRDRRCGSPRPGERPRRLHPAFAGFAAQADEAVLVQPLFISDHSSEIAGLALEHSLPTISDEARFARAGGLMSYGVEWLKLTRRAAHFVDKILRGARPSDLPVEQPTTFELVINLKTAAALGLTIPPTLLARADEVIE